MSTDDDRRTIDRFVAGLPVDADSLATAITAKAVDRTVVIEALLKGLASSEPVVRRRSAQRIQRIPDLAPRVAARLTVLAGTDEDAEARAASAAALRSHGQDVPGEVPPRESARQWAPRILRIELALIRLRGEPIPLEPLRAEDAPDLEGRLFDDQSGVRIALTGLPPEFAGTRPVVRARRERGSPLEAIASAEGPVAPDGEVTMTVTVDDPTLNDVIEWLDNGVDLVVPND